MAVAKELDKASVVTEIMTARTHERALSANLGETRNE